MEEILPKDLSDLLENALDEKIQNFELKQHEGNKKGEGYLGNMLFLSLKNKKTGHEDHLVIKQVLPSETKNTMDFMSISFMNEIGFYTKLVPKFHNFQKSFPDVTLFDKIPKCYATDSERGKEKLVLENVKFGDFELHPKREPVNDKMYEKIFNVYGEYHALCFAFKEVHPEEFLELASSFKNNWLPLFKGILSMAMKHGMSKMKTELENRREDKLVERLQNYVENSSDIFESSIDYKDSYGIISHGDAWSNNMMFKYNASREVEDIKLIDFQMSNMGSPVYDLSYSFYSGANKESLDKLDQFLEIYHNSLSENLKKYGFSAEKIYPFQVLKDEWKKYCPFGFLMGFLVWHGKFIEEGNVPDLSKMMNEKKLDTSKAKIHQGKADGPVIDLIRHMCENDFI